MRGFIALAFTGVVALLALIFLFGSWYTIGQGERGVITHYGAVVGLSEPGLHFKMPMVTGITDVSIQQQITTYGTLDQTDTAHQFETYSADQQPASMVVSVNWHVVDVIGMYSNFGDLDTAQQKLVDPKVYEEIKNVFGQFNAVEAIQNRTALNAKVTAAIQAAVTGGPIRIDSVQIQNIAFSPDYEKAVEERMQATVHQQQALADKAKIETMADADAYKVKANADAYAHQISAVGDAEAHALQAKGDALKANPELVALKLAEKWDGHTPSTVLPSSAAPFVSLH